MAANVQVEQADRNAIAVIGIACRFPGGRNAEEFWRSLADGRDSVSNSSGVPESGRGVTGGRLMARGILTDIDAFDADFFRISAREAELLNPQHRAFLECAWHAFEDAGYDPFSSRDVVSVYATCGFNAYHQLVMPHVRSPAENLLAYISNAADFLPTRVSHKLNLTGESIAVQTACSSSLVAIHLACRSLMDGECTLALAGGSNIAIPSADQGEYQEGMIFSADGRCRAFDHRADGMVAADGVGIVVLKALQRAVADGDQIYGVIIGSALNNDGREKVSYPAPSVSGQAEVIATSLGIAGLSADSISYLEAHGTGTALGDPIEIEALTKAFRLTTERRGYCALGTVKSNIGHAIHSAGVAGLIKVLLALRHETIPPSLHFEKPNTSIDFERSPFFVNTIARPWEKSNVTRRAGVSSFGVGGTNAHVIVEEAPNIQSANCPRSAHLLTLSARTQASLDAAALELASHIETHRDLDIADIAFSLQTGRHSFPVRRAIKCIDSADAIESLRSLDRPPSVCGSPTRPVTFLFPGIGSQNVNMARELYETHPEFRRIIDAGCERLVALLGRDLRDVLYSSAPADELLSDGTLSQPATFLIEYALARLWQSWGIQPSSLVGHSIGEYAAACIAGVFSFEDALSLVASRAQLVAGLPPGAMLALPLDAETAASLLPDRAWIAIINGPSLCVAAGEPEAIIELERRVAAKRIFSTRLATSHAVHTELMRPIEGAFERIVRKVKSAAPQLPVLSGSRGKWLENGEMQDASYWVSHLTQPVNFSSALDHVFQNPESVLLEVGPSNMLGGLARLHPGHGSSHVVVSSLPNGQDRQSDWEVLTNAIGELWEADVAVNWRAFYSGERRLRLPLPGYSFERSRFWIGAENPGLAPAAERPATEKLDALPDWLHRPAWERTRTPPSYSAGDLGDRSGVCLVFAPADQPLRRVEQELTASGQTVVTVSPGETLAEISSRQFTVPALQPKAFEQLLADVERRLGEVLTVLVVPDTRRLKDCRMTSAGQISDGYFNLLHITQALGDRANAVDVWIVTQNGQAVADLDERLDVRPSTLFGLARVIPQEFPHITVRCVDFSDQDIDRRGRVLRLLAEMANPVDDPEFAYRGPDRWVCGNVALPNPETTQLSPPEEDGAWVILGGLGHVGLCLAEFLAGDPPRKLVLISRSAVPAREQWEGILSDPSIPQPLRHRLEKLTALQKRCRSLDVYSADIADRKAMFAVFETLKRKHGKLNAIVHAAGVVDPAHLKFISETTAEMSEAIFRPHVTGSEILSEIARTFKPRLVIMCSSLSSLVGGLSYGAHAAGHRFMDAVAQRQSLRDPAGTRWITINYDTWLVPSRGPGIGAGDTHLHLLPHEGAQILQTALRSAEPQLLVSTIALQPRIADLRSFFGSRTGSSDRPSSEPNAAPVKPLKELSSEDIQNFVLGCFRKVLGDQRLTPNDNFFVFGGSSLSMLDVVSRVNQGLGVRIPLVEGFRAHSASAMAGLAMAAPCGANNAGAPT